MNFVVTGKTHQKLQRIWVIENEANKIVKMIEIVCMYSVFEFSKHF